jgi:FixJ family two-component response regulator
LERKLFQKIVSIVDDNAEVRSAMATLVRAIGWDVWTFPSAEAYLHRSPKTGCLICDVQMPGMSGLDMHAELGKRKAAPPTIFITAYPTPQVTRRALANGALAVLPKPINAASVEEILERVLGDR